MKLIILISTLLFNSYLYGHGGNKPGPNGGKIKMPGMFHTELLLNGPHHFQIYLLDMKFKEPMTEKSTVHYSLNGGKKSLCVPQNKYFSCKTKKMIKKGSIIKVHAKRLNQKGTATYKNLMRKMKKKMKHNMNHH